MQNFILRKVYNGYSFPIEENIIPSEFPCKWPLNTPEVVGPSPSSRPPLKITRNYISVHHPFPAPWSTSPNDLWLSPLPRQQIVEYNITATCSSIQLRCRFQVSPSISSLFNLSLLPSPPPPQVQPK